MSNFEFKAKNKETGEVKVVTALDDYFGRRQYAYLIDGVHLTQWQFSRDWERVEDVEVALDKRVEEIDEEDMTEFERKLAQAILGALEHRGFYDCGKYLDPSIIEHIRPLLTQHHQDLMSEVVGDLKERKFYQYLQVAGFHKEAEDWLTHLVKEVRVGERSTTKEELGEHLKKIGWRFSGRYPNEWIIDHNGERTSYRVLSDSIEVVGVGKTSSVSFHYRGAETVMVDEDAVALGTQQCFILFMNHDLKKKSTTPPPVTQTSRYMG